MVSLTEFCKTNMGKSLLGIEVSQSLKSGWVVSGDSSSHRASSLGIQEIDRWQFCNRIQPPFEFVFITSLIILSAL